MIASNLEAAVRETFRTLSGFACLLMFALATSSASGQVLNLSHDLVTKGIATSNMTPNMPALDSRPLFVAGVAYAVANGIPAIVADQGSYYFLTLNSPYQHVYLDNITKPLTIDLNHSDLFFAHGNIMAIDVNQCTNLTLKNFTVDYLQLPFTQVKVTSVDSSAKTVSFTQLGSYPLPSTFNSLTVPSGYIDDGYLAYIFRNGQQLATTGRMSVVSPLNDSHIQLAGTEPWTQAAELNTIQPGDVLVLEWRAGIGSIYASSSTNITVQDVSVYASGFIGVFTGASSTVTVDHVQVMPRPATDRMISTNADGIHLGKAGANNVITNNTVKRTCDDAIAIDGEWSAVVNAPSSTATVQVARFLTSPLPIGSAFDFISIINASIVGTATIMGENPEPAKQTGNSGELITLTLDHAIAGLQTNFGVVAHDPTVRGSGTVITGNLAQEITFGRGIYPAGVANILISDNMTEATNRCGIVVEQDEALSYGYKTGPSSGITIQNNIVDHALGYGVPSTPVQMDAAGINTLAYDKNFAWVTTQSLTDINVNNNFVTNGIRTGIRVENVNTGQVNGNLVQNWGTAPDSALWYLPVCSTCETLAQVEADFAQAILTPHSVSIAETNDVISGTPVKNLSLADGSRRLAPGSMAVAIGQNFTGETRIATRPALTHKLAGIEVSVKDSAGVSRLADLYYAGPSQVTYVMPEDTAPGVATVTVGSQRSGALVSSVAPGLFSADGTGSGVALARAERFAKTGPGFSEAVYQCSATCVAVPLDLGTSSDTLLVYFQGTGISGRSSLANVTAEVGGVFAKVEAAERLHHADPGADYVSVEIPHSLAGAGEVPVVVTVDGFTANVVSIDIK